MRLYKLIQLEDINVDRSSNGRRDAIRTGDKNNYNLRVAVCQKVAIPYDNPQSQQRRSELRLVEGAALHLNELIKPNQAVFAR